MKSKTIKSIILMVAMLCLLCFPVQVMAETQQGTNGDELQLMEAEKLEIQLGTDWAGVEFQLKTDAGLYPGTVVVGQDGVLRMEIGGSKSYILTCMNSAITVPEPTQAPATTETDPEETNHGTETAEEGSHNRCRHSCTPYRTLCRRYGGGCWCSDCYACSEKTPRV